MSEAYAYDWQYRGGAAERDTGPPTGTARAAREPELSERRSHVMPMSPIRPRPGNLREVAEQIEQATGLRVQIVGGSLVMSPTPRGQHAGVVRRLRRQLDRHLDSEAAPDLAAYEVSSIGMSGDPDDYVTPDLIVLPLEWDDDVEWLAEPQDVTLAVEVISQSEKAREMTQKQDWYAVAGVPSLLVIDPRHGTWALHTRPEHGSYQDVCRGKYGEDVVLPAPLGFVLSTDGLPVYGEERRRSG